MNRLLIIFLNMKYNNAGLQVEVCNKSKAEKFLVIGHRGNGMNKLQSSDPRMKSIKENSILSFNTAASFNLDFVEFDVQVFLFSSIFINFPVELLDFIFIYFGRGRGSAAEIRRV